MTEYSRSQSFKKRNLDQHPVALQAQFPTSTQLLWEAVLAATVQSTSGSRWAASHTLFEEYAFLQSGKIICRRKLGLCTVVVFELTPSSISLPGPFVLRRLLFTTTRRQLKVNCLVTATDSLRWDLELVRRIPTQSLTIFGFIKPKTFQQLSLSFPDPFLHNLAETSRLSSSVEVCHRSFWGIWAP